MGLDPGQSLLDLVDLALEQVGTEHQERVLQGVLLHEVQHFLLLHSPRQVLDSFGSPHEEHVVSSSGPTH